MYPDLLKLVFHSEILVLVFKCTKLLKFLFLVFMVQNMYDSLITIYFCSFYSVSVSVIFYIIGHIALVGFIHY